MLYIRGTSHGPSLCVCLCLSQVGVLLKRNVLFPVIAWHRAMLCGSRTISLRAKIIPFSRLLFRRIVSVWFFCAIQTFLFTYLHPVVFLGVFSLLRTNESNPLRTVHLIHKQFVFNFALICYSLLHTYSRKFAPDDWLRNFVIRPRSLT